MNKKILIPISFLGFTMLFGCSEKREQLEIGYYESLSALCFDYSSIILEYLSESEKQHFSRGVAFVMFAYYLDSRYGRTLPSWGIDKMIRITYYLDYKSLEYKEIDNPFKDPLGWKLQEVPRMSIGSSLPSLSREKYLDILDDFIEFLELKEDEKESEENYREGQKGSDVNGVSLRRLSSKK
jgi:hypothetical protein